MDDLEGIDDLQLKSDMCQSTHKSMKLHDSDDLFNFPGTFWAEYKQFKDLHIWLHNAQQKHYRNLSKQPTNICKFSYQKDLLNTNNNFTFLSNPMSAKKGKEDESSKYTTRGYVKETECKTEDSADPKLCNLKGSKEFNMGQSKPFHANLKSKMDEKHICYTPKASKTTLEKNSNMYSESYTQKYTGIPTKIRNNECVDLYTKDHTDISPSDPKNKYAEVYKQNHTGIPSKAQNNMFEDLCIDTHTGTINKHIEDELNTLYNEHDIQTNTEYTYSSHKKPYEIESKRWESEQKYNAVHPSKGFQSCNKNVSMGVQSMYKNEGKKSNMCVQSICKNEGKKPTIDVQSMHKNVTKKPKMCTQPTYKSVAKKITVFGQSTCKSETKKPLMCAQPMCKIVAKKQAMHLQSGSENNCMRDRCVDELATKSALRNINAQQQSDPKNTHTSSKEGQKLTESFCDLNKSNSVRSPDLYKTTVGFCNNEAVVENSNTCVKYKGNSVENHYKYAGDNSENVYEEMPSKNVTNVFGHRQNCSELLSYIEELESIVAFMKFSKNVKTKQNDSIS